MEVVLNATNIKINSLLTDTTGTGFYALADNYLGVHIANTHVNVSCDYSANILGSPEKGSAWIYIDGIDLRTAATFEIQDGFPAISIKSTNFTYNSFSLKTDLESFL